MDATFTLATTSTGATALYTLRESPDWTVLVNRVITQRFGSAAARNRQDIDSDAYGPGGRTWRGVVNGATYSITEVLRVAELVAVTDAADALSAATNAAATAKDARDRSVNAALAAGISAKLISRSSGLTEARVYQIRDNRR